MEIRTFGPQGAPVIVMLGASFCPADAMAYLYAELARDYFVIVPEYNGHYEGTTFTTRQGEAREAAGYLLACGIPEVRLLYGMSMGAEVGIELLSQLTKRGIAVQSAFFDGAPCIKLPRADRVKAFLKFKALLGLCRGRSVDALLRLGPVKKFSNGDAESLRPMLASIQKIAPRLTDKTVRAETECCYTFDFPPLAPEVQKRMHFFYAKEEKAYQACFARVRGAYPQANYKVVSGYGHLTYSVRHKDKYLAMLRELCEKA